MLSIVLYFFKLDYGLTLGLAFLPAETAEGNDKNADEVENKGDQETDFHPVRHFWFTFCRDPLLLQLLPKTSSSKYRSIEAPCESILHFLTLELDALIVVLHHSK